MSDQELNKIFARNLNYYMSLNNLRQVDLVEKFGVAKGIASSWCRGEKMPRMDKIDQMCKYFGIEWSDLMTDKQDKKEPNYYMDESVKNLANLIKEDSNYRVLFDAVKKVKPGDISLVSDMINRISREK